MIAVSFELHALSSLQRIAHSRQTGAAAAAGRGGRSAAGRICAVRAGGAVDCALQSDGDRPGAPARRSVCCTLGGHRRAGAGHTGAPALGRADFSGGFSDRGGGFPGAGAGRGRSGRVLGWMGGHGADDICDEYLSGASRDSAGDCVCRVSGAGIHQPGAGAGYRRMGRLRTAGAGAGDGGARARVCGGGAGAGRRRIADFFSGIFFPILCSRCWCRRPSAWRA